MATAYIFTLQPTFTQGLVLGQASILVLLFVVLKYLFFDTDEGRPYRVASYQPKVEPSDAEGDSFAARVDPGRAGSALREGDAESAEWLNVFLQQVRPCLHVISHELTHLS